MEKIINEIQMEDYTVSLIERAGRQYVKLSSGVHGSVLEIERTKDGVNFRELEIGGADLTYELLALMLILIEADQDLVKEIERINKIRESYRS
ncbi:hypothetical protein JOD45_002639 [Scopulibacillus daqui]|uniref:Uncharacterized protein n=1 Tax=Scopulibacillus daqui TaxID=1469162 RepID=A0ABS2Q286_9BACL|nr:hypothetical protein [Scopulibacillus daqui]MBM7646411.1 hypothetical protein [Scopulibacillus daqui]